MDNVSRNIEQLRRDKRFFHLFSEAELEVLSPLFHLTRCRAGEVLIEEGNPVGGPLAIVVGGALEIKKRTDFGGALVLAKVSRGALLGYSSIYPSNRPFPITAVALEETDILFMQPDQVARIMEQYPTIAVKMLREVIRVQDIRLQELLARFTATL